MRALGLLLVGGMCACGGLDDGFGVATTVVFDSSVSDAALARMSKLDIDVSGDESFSGSQALGTALRIERFIYRPRSSSHDIVMTLDGVDADGVLLATGQSGLIALTSGATTQSSVVLHATPSPDGGGAHDDLGQPDFAGEDLTGVDLAHGGHVDLGPDLVYYDASGGSSLCSKYPDGGTLLGCWGYENANDVANAFTNNGTVTIDTSRHFRGASSMHASTTTGTEAWIAQTKYGVIPYPGPTEVHVRAFLYATQTLSGTPLVDLYSNFYSGYLIADELRVGSGGVLQVIGGIAGTVDAGTASIKTSATKLPLNAWTCFELVVTPSKSATGTIQVYMNETHLTDLDYTGITVTEEEGYLGGTNLGLNFDSSTKGDIWVDEVMAATTQIGCEM